MRRDETNVHMYKVAEDEAKWEGNIKMTNKKNRDQMRKEEKH